MTNRTAEIHHQRILNIQELIPVEFTDNDLNWIVDWLLSIGIGSIHAALEKYPKLTVHDLFIISTKLTDDVEH